MFTLGEIIDLAVRIEKNGQNTYEKAGGKIPDPILAATLKWLAEQEAEHEKWFVRLREKMPVEAADPKMDEMGRKMLQGVLGDRAFSIEEADFSNLKDLNSLLELSVEFEKDTVLFYEMLGGFIEEEETLNDLKTIIEEENSHIRRLEEILTGS